MPPVGGEKTRDRTRDETQGKAARRRPTEERSHFGKNRQDPGSTPACRPSDEGARNKGAREGASFPVGNEAVSHPGQAGAGKVTGGARTARSLGTRTEKPGKT